MFEGVLVVEGAFTPFMVRVCDHLAAGDPDLMTSRQALTESIDQQVAAQSKV